MPTMLFHDLLTVALSGHGLAAMAVTGVALAFRPWATLRQTEALQHPWLAVLVVLPWFWATQKIVPFFGPQMQLSGACLMVLMFGWPLAMLTLWPVAFLGGWLAGVSMDRTTELLLWNGMMPGTLALLIGLATRRFLPHHLFVYILGRGFLTTALALGISGSVWLWMGPATAAQASVVPSNLSELLIGRWLISWAEAFATGGMTAIFVAFHPEWMVTYSDQRYLPKQERAKAPSSRSQNEKR
ncbi:hypothetical protein [Leptothrix ochracea]|uniref:hypothetical protein n=1 Tax=Leptothrix ochracea TaxID=735331 RepID=UPI0034E2D86E